MIWEAGEMVQKVTRFGDVVPILDAGTQFGPVGGVVVTSVVKLRPSFVVFRTGKVAGDMVGKHGGGYDGI
jgi:hypothetical protein